MMASAEVARVGWGNELERRPIMWLILLEALAALALLLFFVWWTMFSGRRREAEPPAAEEPGPTEQGIPTTRPHVRVGRSDQGPGGGGKERDGGDSI